MRSWGKSDIVTVELCKASQGLCHKGLAVLVFHLSLSLQQPLPEVVERLTDTGVYISQKVAKFSLFGISYRVFHLNCAPLKVLSVRNYFNWLALRILNP